MEIINIEKKIIREYFEEKEYGVEFEDNVCYLDSHNRHLMLYRGDCCGSFPHFIWVLEYESGLVDKFDTLGEAIRIGRDYFDFYWDKKVE